MEKVSAVSLMKNMYGICIPVECDIQLIFHRRRKMGGGRGQGGGERVEVVWTFLLSSFLSSFYLSLGDGPI